MSQPAENLPQTTDQMIWEIHQQVMWLSQTVSALLTSIPAPMRAMMARKVGKNDGPAAG